MKEEKEVRRRSRTRGTGGYVVGRRCQLPWNCIDVCRSTVVTTTTVGYGDVYLVLFWEEGGGRREGKSLFPVLSFLLGLRAAVVVSRIAHRRRMSGQRVRTTLTIFFFRPIAH